MAPSLPCSVGRARTPPSAWLRGVRPVQGSEAHPVGRVGDLGPPPAASPPLSSAVCRTCSGPPASTAASSGPTSPSTASPGSCSSSWLSGTAAPTPAAGDPDHSPPPSEPPLPHLQDGTARLPLRVWRNQVTREWRAPRDSGSGGSGPVDVHLLGGAALGSAGWSLLLTAAPHTSGAGGGLTQPHCTDEEAEAGSAVRGELDSGQCLSLPHVQGPGEPLVRVDHADEPHPQGDWPREAPGLGQLAGGRWVGREGCLLGWGRGHS